MSRRLETPETRACQECSRQFVATWTQRLCNPCRYNRATRGKCAKCGAKTGHSGRVLCGPCRYGDPPAILPMSRVDRAWITAIVEGEGTFNRVRRPCGYIRVAMTDQDIVQRLRDVTGLGLVHSRGRRMAHQKDVWDWTVTRRANVCTLAETLAPLLLSRRRASLEPILRADGRMLPSVIDLRPGLPESWAWVAGLIEGEGWIGPGPETAKRAPVVGVESTDYDVVERLGRLTELGHINSIINVPPGMKPKWRWSIHSRAGTWRVLTSILPLLGERRRARAMRVLDVIGS
jgi:hypothetical protein